MKKIYLVFVETEAGKHYSHAETIKTGENLMNFVRRYPKLKAMHICETATQAAFLTEEWNKSFKANGTSLY